jgi:predicted metalloprotease
MAFWDRISSTGNIDDRRGLGGGGLGAGASLAVIGAVLLFNLFGLEVDPNTVGQIVSQFDQSTVSTQEQPPEFAGEDDYEVFVSRVVGSANDMWKGLFAANNESYREPRVVLFRGATSSGCGFASSSSGPHYCPNDETVYLDETFFDELKDRLGGSNEDVAQAYVLAHEVGHHAQNRLGLLSNSSSNEQSVRTELQADCFAGLWAHSVKNLGVFENNEINEAIQAAEAVGDDRIQQTTTGRVNPETWTHGSSAQRVQWFNTGYNTGDFAACDTSG